MRRTAQIQNPRPLKGLTWLAVLASVCLALTLATRYIRPLCVAGNFAVVSADSVVVPWQKLETNAVLWALPVILASALQVSDFRPPLPDALTLRDGLLDDSLHNRPPPSC
jgi:hypothetical protein